MKKVGFVFLLFICSIVLVGCGEGGEIVQGPQGDDGREIILQVNDGFVQWQHEGDAAWRNLIEVSVLIGPSGSNGIDGIDGTNSLDGIDGEDGNDGLNGEDGRELILQVADGYIQWQYVGDQVWTNLINTLYLTGLDGLSGMDGIDGMDGLTPYVGDNGNWWTGATDTGVFAGYRYTGIQQAGEFIFGVNSEGNSYYLFEYTGYDKYVVIPGEYNGYPVTEIGDAAFEGNNIIETVVIPKDVVTIGFQSFSECWSLHTVLFEEGSVLETIRANVFYDAIVLQNIILPDTLISIGPGAFNLANAVASLSIVIPDSVGVISMNAFVGNPSHYIYVYTESAGSPGWHILAFGDYVDVTYNYTG